MSDTKISDRAVDAAISMYRSEFEWTDRLDRDAMRAALEAALPHLHGEAVAVVVAHGWLVARPDVSPFFVPATHPHIIESFQTALAVECGTTVTAVYLHPQPAALSEVSGDSGELAEQQGVELPEPLDYLRYATQHAINVNDEGVDFAIPRPMIDALTHLKIVEKVGRGKWSVNVEVAQKVVAALAATGKQQVGKVQGVELRERTPVDFAIEHAGYLVNASQRLLKARGELDSLVMRRDEDDAVDDSDMHAAQDCVDEAEDSLRSAIYEFEKRRDRALAARIQHGEWGPLPDAMDQYADHGWQVGEAALDFHLEVQPELGPDSDCTEVDGCPTEMAVLKRFWREHAACPNPTENKE